MSKITYFSLGGQDEKWKYSGALEINGDIFVLNTGVGCAITNQYGVQKVIPDLTYLRTNKTRVKGIFFGTPRKLNIGALPYYLDFLADIPIYTSAIGKEIILAFLEEFSAATKREYKPNIIVVNPINEITVSAIKVIPIRVANCIPNSFAWLFKTLSGEYVVFVDEFLVANENLPCCENQIHFITQHAKNKTALLIVGTQSVGKTTTFAQAQAQNFYYLKKACSSTKKRVLIALYEDDWYTMLNLSKISKIYGMVFHIACPKMSKLFNIYIEQLKREEYAKSSPFVEGDDTLIVIVGDHDKLYERLESILHDKEEIKLNNNDLLIISTITYPEKEIEEINLLNEISKKDIVLIKQPKSMIHYNAGNEDLKLLINSISPYNIVPINCYYKDYVNFEKALENTVNLSRIKFLELGQSLVIDGKNTNIVNIPITEQFVNEEGVMDVNKTIILERQLITQNGAILVSIIYNQPKHVFVIAGIEMMGIFVDEEVKNAEVSKVIKKYLTNDLSKFLALHKILEIKSLKNLIKRTVYQSLEDFTQKKPIILPVITNLN